MKRRIVYTDEPITIGRRVGREVLSEHGGSRRGAGRPPLGKRPVTLRLPPKLLDAVRKGAEKAGLTLSEFVEAKLRA